MLKVLTIHRDRLTATITMYCIGVDHVVDDVVTLEGIVRHHALA